MAGTASQLVSVATDSGCLTVGAPGNDSFTRQRIPQAAPIGFGVGRPVGIGGG